MAQRPEQHPNYGLVCDAPQRAVPFVPAASRAHPCSTCITPRGCRLLGCTHRDRGEIRARSETSREDEA